MIKTERRGLPTQTPRTMIAARRGNIRALRTLVAVAEPPAELVPPPAPQLIVRTDGQTRTLGCWWNLRYPGR